MTKMVLKGCLYMMRKTSSLQVFIEVGCGVFRGVFVKLQDWGLWGEAGG